MKTKAGVELMQQRSMRFLVLFLAVLLLVGVTAPTSVRADNPSQGPYEDTTPAEAKKEACGYGCGEKGCKCPVSAEQMFEIITEHFYKRRLLPALQNLGKQMEQGSQNQGMHATANTNALATQMALQNAANMSQRIQDSLGGAQKQACEFATAAMGSTDASYNADMSTSSDGSNKGSGDSSKPGPSGTTGPNLVTALAKATPDTAISLGRYEYAKAMIKKSIADGTFAGNGNNNGNKTIGGSSDGNDSDDLGDALESSTTVALPDTRISALETAIQRVYGTPLDPVPANMLKDIDAMDKNVLLSVAEGENFRTASALASYPARRELARRKKQSGGSISVMSDYSVSSSSTFDSSGNGKLNAASAGLSSLAAAEGERKRFYDFYVSPAYPSRLLQVSTKKDIEMAYNTGQNVAMTYDVRQELKMTNILLGAIYRELMDSRYNRELARRATIQGASGQ